MIRGYHVYKAVRDAQIGEELLCATEPGNIRDLYAVVVKKSSLTVGHIPMKISTLCSLFLQRGGIITCQVTSLKRYSHDLGQGGLEIPCVLKFEGDAKLVNKVKKLVKKPGPIITKQSEIKVVTIIKEEDSEDIPAKKKVCTGVNIADLIESINRGEDLTDLHMEHMQKLLKQKFPHINGLQPTVCLTRTNKKTTPPISV